MFCQLCFNRCFPVWALRLPTDCHWFHEINFDYERLSDYESHWNFPHELEELKAPPQDVSLLGIAVHGEETILEQWDFNHFCSTAQEFGYFCVREKNNSGPLSCGLITAADCSASNVVFPAALLEHSRISPPSLFARNPNIYGVNCALKLWFGFWQFHFWNNLLARGCSVLLLVAAVSCSSFGTVGMSHAHGRIPMRCFWHFSIFSLFSQDFSALPLFIWAFVSSSAHRYCLLWSEIPAFHSPSSLWTRWSAQK